MISTNACQSLAVPTEHVSTRSPLMNATAQMPGKDQTVQLKLTSVRITRVPMVALAIMWGMAMFVFALQATEVIISFLYCRCMIGCTYSK